MEFYRIGETEVYVPSQWNYNHFAYFPQRQARYYLPQSPFYRYVQVRHFVERYISDFPTKPQDHDFYNLLVLKPNSEHLIFSFCYYIWEATKDQSS